MLWDDPLFRSQVSIAEVLHKPLFELRPDVFPEQRLTPVETLIWGYYFTEKSERMKQNG